MENQQQLLALQATIDKLAHELTSIKESSDKFALQLKLQAINDLSHMAYEQAGQLDGFSNLSFLKFPKQSYSNDSVKTAIEKSTTEVQDSNEIDSSLQDDSYEASEFETELLDEDLEIPSGDFEQHDLLEKSEPDIPFDFMSHSVFTVPQNPIENSDLPVYDDSTDESDPMNLLDLEEESNPIEGLELTDEFKYFDELVLIDNQGRAVSPTIAGTNDNHESFENKDSEETFDPFDIIDPNENITTKEDLKTGDYDVPFDMIGELDAQKPTDLIGDSNNSNIDNKSDQSTVNKNKKNIDDEAKTIDDNESEKNMVLNKQSLSQKTSNKPSIKNKTSDISDNLTSQSEKQKQTNIPGAREFVDKLIRQCIADHKQPPSRPTL